VAKLTPEKIAELLPCPFCGGEAHLVIEDEFSRFRCSQCGATGAPAEYGREYDATAAWNRRASHSLASAHEVKLTPGWLARDIAIASARLQPQVSVGGGEDAEEAFRHWKAEAHVERTRAEELEKALDREIAHADELRQSATSATMREAWDVAYTSLRRARATLEAPND